MCFTTTFYLRETFEEHEIHRHHYGKSVALELFELVKQGFFLREKR